MRGFGEFVQFQLEYGVGAGAQIGELVLEFGMTGRESRPDRL